MDSGAWAIVISAIIALLPAILVARTTRLQIDAERLDAHERRKGELEQVRLDAIQITSEALSGAIGELRTTLSHVTEDLQEQLEINSSHVSARRELEKRLTVNSEEISKNNYAITALQGTLTDQDRIIKGLRKQTFDQDELIKRLQSSLQGYVEAVKLLTAQVVELGATPSVTANDLRTLFQESS